MQSWLIALQKDMKSILQAAGASISQLQMLCRSPSADCIMIEANSSTNSQELTS